MGDDAMLAPTRLDRRLHNLDVLRGFALLGILLMNVEFFGRPLADLDAGVDPNQAPFDHALSWLVYVFVQGKFWILFSLLFGMGFALMGERARAAGRNFTAVYLRRSLALLAIGLAHAVLIWSGDILITYAIGALLLLLFRDVTPRAQGAWGAALFGVPALLMIALAMLLLAINAVAGLDEGGLVDGAELARMQAARAAEVAAYAEGSWWQATRMRVDYLLGNIGETLIFEVFALGMFLVGAWLLRSGAIAQPQRHAALYRWLRYGALPVGLAMAVASGSITATFDWVHDSARSMFAAALMLLASPLLSLGYLALVIGALQTTRGQRVFGVLAPAGRMALTNYLVQSLIGTWIFYGYGLGLWGQVPRRWQLLGVLVVFALQVVFSRWWLERFRQGPVEWLWRACTYGRFPPMRPAAAHNP
ncbi:DUF418 domain-containing protein [Lysobacter panacisoli]|uniref:DUF418 domain-containing protein n=1 Tax=Lysobacter panacisoli TaxID=1255263 RepID=UPI003CCE4A96